MTARTEATAFGWWLGQAVRATVGVLLLGGLLGAALGAARSVSLPVLAEDLTAGRVAEVVFTESDAYRVPGLADRDQGPAVRWKVVGAGWRTAGLDGEELTPVDPTASGLPAVRNETEIRRLAATEGVPVSGPGDEAPRQLVTLASLTILVLVVLMIGGPQPRRATKWAWFWLLLVPGGLTALVWLAVEAPWSSRANRRPEPLPHRQQPDDRRLTGGRALLEALVLTAVLAVAGTGLANWLAG